MNELLEPAVALLFDDTELGGHLREALQQRGARIVHEGGVAGFNQSLLEQLNADVLVVNLDDTVDDVPDELYDLLSAGRPRVVFNDAQASRDLDGWDRARWARHLAVKVMAEGDLDPPRPSDAPGLDLPDAAVEQATAAAELAAGTSTSALAADAEAVEAENERKQVASAKSETLAAELEALLSSGELPDDTDASDSVEDWSGTGEGSPHSVEEWSKTGEGSPHSAGEWSHTGEGSPPEFDQAASVFVDDTVESAGEQASDDGRLFGRAVEDEQPENTLAMPTQEFVAEGLDALFAPARDDVDEASPNSAESHAVPLDSTPDADALASTLSSTEDSARATPPPISAPTEWALLDESDLQQGSPGQDELSDAAAFGIEKQSAAEFLAPNAEPGDDDVQPTMNLELVSLEEAVAPQAWQPDHEMVLDDTGTALSRIVLLGAASSATESVGDFLAALPGTTRLTFLLTQHLGASSSASLLEQLSARSSLPVRMAQDNGVARAGEVLIAPPDVQTILRRDGRVTMASLTAEGASQSQAIDACLTAAAGAFGRDAVAIVFAGNGTDAVGGCQAVHDRGGRVWVESASGDYAADMVGGIFAEQLVDFSGTSQELAAHLIEVFP